MGYGSESRHNLMNPDAAFLAAVALQTPADKAVVTVLSPATVLRLTALVTVATTGVAVVVALDKRVTYASEVGRVELGRMTIPIGTAVGKSVFKDIVGDVAPGEQVVVELITAATAGSAIFGVEHIPRSDYAASMVASV